MANGVGFDLSFYRARDGLVTTLMKDVHEHAMAL